MNDKPVISVKEARKLLGKTSESMDDDQILIVIRLLTELAENILENKYVNKARNNLG